MEVDGSITADAGRRQDETAGGLTGEDVSRKVAKCAKKRWRKEKMENKKRSWFRICVEGAFWGLVLVKVIQIWLIALGAGG